MSNYSEVTYWLALINESGLKLNLVKPIIQRWCIAERRNLAELFELSPLDITTTFGLSDAEAGQLLRAVSKLTGQASLLAQWQAEGIEPLLRVDPRFPRRLTHTLPPAQQPLLLWTRGPAKLLNQPGVTILGGKELEQTTAEFIDELMGVLETEEIGLISGYSRGLDRVTFERMLTTANGFAVAVLPMGLNAFAKTTNRLDSAVEAKRAVLISPFTPSTSYDDRLAEARNILIDHLTMALLIPESDDETQARALAALERGLPVFVKANTAGNRALLDQGALLLTDPGEVVDWVQQAMVDAAMLESEEEEATESLIAAPLAATAPADHPQADDDYSLQGETVPLLDADEALEILSLGGELPEVLRKRLKNKVKDDE